VQVNKADLLEAEDPSRGVNLRVPCFSRIDEAKLRGQLERDHFFWLDLTDPTEDDLLTLGRIFHFHPLALEDAAAFGQRPKLDDYGDYAFLVFYGAQERLKGEDGGVRMSEVQMFVSGQYVITLHRDPLPALEEQRNKIEGRVMHSEQFLIYRILDALTDSFFPLLSEIDDEIDELEDAVIQEPTGEQLQRIFALKRDLVSMRKVVTPQRDIFARSIDQLSELPGLQLDERDYFRDVYDHLIRISDLIDSYRDLLGGATDIYLSTVANRQNEVMKQLAIVATIFLPLTFLTGFFGQNFGWLVVHAISPQFWKFALFGVGSLIASCAALYAWFKRKGWM
jgi:magnesium transporter